MGGGELVGGWGDGRWGVMGNGGLIGGWGYGEWGPDGRWRMMGGRGLMVGGLMGGEGPGGEWRVTGGGSLMGVVPLWSPLTLPPAPVPKHSAPPTKRGPPAPLLHLPSLWRSLPDLLALLQALRKKQFQTHLPRPLAPIS